MSDKRHYDGGYWRAYIDGVAQDIAEAEAHLKECAVCQGVVERLTANKAVVEKSLAVTAPERVPAWMPEAGYSAISRQTILKITAATATAVIALTFLLLPPARTIAGEFLQLFRAEKFEAIKIDPRAMAGFGPDKIGKFTFSEPLGEEVTTLEEAEQRTGLKLSEPGNLPPGLSRSAMYVTTAGKISLVFDLKKFRRYLSDNHIEGIDLPYNLHGSTLTIMIPPVAMAEYAATGNTGDADLVVAQAGVPEIAVADGVDFDKIRDELLKLPIFPPNVRDQLANIQDWKRTLPIPYPGDQAESEKVVVADNRDGLYFQGKQGEKVLIWTDGKQSYGLIAPPRSSLSRVDLFSVARTL